MTFVSPTRDDNGEGEGDGEAMATRLVNKPNHQNSLRLARPVKVAYFLNPRAIAPPKLMP